MSRRSRGLGVALISVVLAGCGSGHEDAVREVGETYADAVTRGDWRTACHLLAPTTREELQQSTGRPCVDAMRSLDPPAVDGTPSPSVFGTQAQLDYGNDTLFLSPYDGEWRIVAAVCTARPAAPYDCTVSGG